jgi:hypothetical protein
VPKTGVNKVAITNKSLLEFTCPSNDAKCPADNKLEVTDATVVSKSVEWKEPMPNPAYDWNCKYKVSVAKTYQDSIAVIPEADRANSKQPAKGYLVVGVAANGFGGTINIIGQKNGKWVDQTSNENDFVRVYPDAKFAQKFFFPIDWDIFVTFEPTGNYEGIDVKSSAARFDI